MINSLKFLLLFRNVKVPSTENWVRFSYRFTLASSFFATYNNIKCESYEKEIENQKLKLRPANGNFIQNLHYHRRVFLGDKADARVFEVG